MGAHSTWVDIEGIGASFRDGLGGLADIKQYNCGCLKSRPLNLGDMEAGRVD